MSRPTPADYPRDEAIVATPKGHATFDVHYSGRFLGSVWRFNGEWVAYRPDMRALAVIYETFDDAVEGLREEAQR